MNDLSTMKDNETFYNQRSSNLLQKDGTLSENDKNARNSKILQSLNEEESLNYKKNVFTPKLETKSPKNYTNKIFNQITRTITHSCLSRSSSGHSSFPCINFESECVGKNFGQENNNFQHMETFLKASDN